MRPLAPSGLQIGKLLSALKKGSTSQLQGRRTWEGWGKEVLFIQQWTLGYLELGALAAFKLSFPWFPFPAVTGL